jgi:hypothetical protein
MSLPVPSLRRLVERNAGRIMGARESKTAGHDDQTTESWTIQFCISDAGQFPSAGASRLGELRSDGKLAGVTINFSAGRAEPRGHRPGARTIGDCLASLRPSERLQRERNLWSGRGGKVERVQSWRVRLVRGPNSADAWHKARSASIRSVRPGELN